MKYKPRDGIRSNDRNNKGNNINIIIIIIIQYKLLDRNSC